MCSGTTGPRAQQPFPQCVKVTSNPAAVRPTPPPQRLLGTSSVELWFFMCLTCVVVFSCGLSFTQSVNLLSVTHYKDQWSETPRVMPLGNNSSPTSRTPPLCLSVFILQPLLFLSVSVSTHLLGPPPPLTDYPFLLSSSSPPLPPATPRTPGQVWVSLIPSVWRGYATSVGALSARVVGQAQPTSPSMHHSECATNEHDWRNVAAPVPCLFFFLRQISFSLNGGTVYDGSARNKEWKYRVGWPWDVCGNLSDETGDTLHVLLRLSREESQWVMCRSRVGDFPKERRQLRKLWNGENILKWIKVKSQMWESTSSAFTSDIMWKIVSLNEHGDGLKRGGWGVVREISKFKAFTSILFCE